MGGNHRTDNLHEQYELGYRAQDQEVTNKEFVNFIIYLIIFILQDVRKQRYIRISLMVVILGFLTVVTLTQSFLVSENIACIEDKVFNLTSKLNEYFSENYAAKHAYMIICGLLMDVMVLSQFYRFGMYGTTWRFPIALLMFYILRALIQVIS